MRLRASRAPRCGASDGAPSTCSVSRWVIRRREVTLEFVAQNSARAMTSPYGLQRYAITFHRLEDASCVPRSFWQKKSAQSESRSPEVLEPFLGRTRAACYIWTTLSVHQAKGRKKAAAVAARKAEACAHPEQSCTIKGESEYLTD